MALNLSVDPNSIFEGDQASLNVDIDELVGGDFVEVSIDFNNDGTFDETFTVVDNGTGDTGIVDENPTENEISFTLPFVFPDDEPITGTSSDDIPITVNVVEQDLLVEANGVYVFDDSGSTSSSSGIDVDGDGNPDSIFDAEIAALISLNEQIRDRDDDGTVDNPDALIGAVAFSSSAITIDMDPITDGVQTFNEVGADRDGDGVFDVDEALLNYNPQFGGTNYEPALQNSSMVIDDILAEDPGVGVTQVFLSDGFPFSTTNYIDEANAIKAKADSQAFGVGSGSSLAALQPIDSDQAQQFTSIQDFLDFFGSGVTQGFQATESTVLTVNNVSPDILEEDLTLTLTPLPNGGDDDDDDDDDDVKTYDVTIEGIFTDPALGVDTESFFGTATEWTVESFDDDDNDDDDDEVKFLFESTELIIDVVDDGSGNFTGTFSTTNQLLVEDDDLFDDDGGSINVTLTLSDDDLGTDEVEFTQLFAGDDDDDSIRFNGAGSSSSPDFFSSGVDPMGDDSLATNAVLLNNFTDV